MHELQAVAALFRKANKVAEQEGAKRVTRVEIRVGAFSHLSEDHLREHFVQAAVGSLLEAAEWEISTSDDWTDPNAQEVELLKVEVE